MKSPQEYFSMQEITAAYDHLLKKGRRRIHIPLAFQQNELVSAPALYSLLPVGSDGATTCSVEKNKEQFFREIYRIMNQSEKDDTGRCRLRFKKYSIKELTNDKGKTRQIVKLCLRDQVITRVVLTRLNRFNILGNGETANPSPFEMARDILAEMRNRQGNYIVIKTDIRNFYHSVNRELLLKLLHDSHGAKIGPHLFSIIQKAVADNKSSHEYTGLPVGMSLSVLLGDYYIRATGIHQTQPGVRLYRYVDDILVIADRHIHPGSLLAEVDHKLCNLGLERSSDKTNISEGGSVVRFLGMDLSEEGISIENQKIAQIKKRVQDDINREFLYYHLAHCAGLPVKKPANKELVKQVRKEHFMGIRSRSVPHLMKIEKYNRQEIDQTGHST